MKRKSGDQITQQTLRRLSGAGQVQIAEVNVWRSKEAYVDVIYLDDPSHSRGPYHAPESLVGGLDPYDKDASIARAKTLIGKSVDYPDLHKVSLYAGYVSVWGS